MAFQQAQIAVTKTEDFEQLKSALERDLQLEQRREVLRQAAKPQVYVREFEKILSLGILESVDSALAKSGKTARRCMRR